MRIDTADMGTLLRASPRSVGPSSRLLARQHRTAALALLARYGHCRASDIARAVWPDARYSMQMANRTLRVLVASGHVLVRRNALGTRSYILSRVGAAHLSSVGIPARHGCDIVSIRGATFVHRCIETRFCIEEELRGAQCFGEYAIARGIAPLGARAIARRFGKLPDCLSTRGTSVDWCEVEASAKSTDELLRILNMARYVGMPLAPTLPLVLGRVVVVFDGQRNHLGRIMRAAAVAWVGLPLEEQRRLSKAVLLVSASFSEGFCWRDSVSGTLYEALHGRDQG